MIGTEYRTSNAQIAFPFKEDADGLARILDPVHGLTATIPEDLVIDALFTMPDTVTTLYLNRIDANSATEFTFVFWDQLSNEVLTIDLDTTEMSGAYHVINGADLDEIQLTTGKVILGVEAATAYLAGISGTDMFSSTLPLERSTVEPLNPKVLSFRLYNDDVATPPEHEPPNSGEVKIMSGYNTVTSLEEETDTDTTELLLDIQPTAGEGLAPCEEEDVPAQPLRMSLRPDNAGNFNIQSGEEECYNIVPIGDTIEIQGVCEACCSCQDYIDMVEALNRLLENAKTVYCTLRYAHDGPNAAGAQDCVTPERPTTNASYTRGVEYFNSVIVDRFVSPTVKVNGAVGASPGGGAEKGEEGTKYNSHSWVKFVVVIHNGYDEDIEVTAYGFGMSQPAGGVMIHSVYEQNVAGVKGRYAIEDSDIVGLVIPKNTTLKIEHEYSVPFEEADYPQYAASVGVTVGSGDKTWDLTDSVVLKHASS